MVSFRTLFSRKQKPTQVLKTLIQDLHDHVTNLADDTLYTLEESSLILPENRKTFDVNTTGDKQTSNAVVSGVSNTSLDNFNSFSETVTRVDGHNGHHHHHDNESTVSSTEQCKYSSRVLLRSASVEECCVLPHRSEFSDDFFLYRNRKYEILLDVFRDNVKYHLSCLDILTSEDISLLLCDSVNSNLSMEFLIEIYFAIMKTDIKTSKKYMGRLFTHPIILKAFLFYINYPLIFGDFIRHLIRSQAVTDFNILVYNIASFNSWKKKQPNIENVTTPPKIEEPLPHIFTHYVYSLFPLFVHDNFDVSSDAFQTLITLTLVDKEISSYFLHVQYDLFVGQYYSSLISNNTSYSILLQGLRFLSDVLLDRRFISFMLDYVNDYRNLKSHLKLFAYSKSSIKVTNFNIIKLFVANPNKSYYVHRLIWQNRQKLAYCVNELFYDDKMDFKELQAVVDVVEASRGRPSPDDYLMLKPHLNKACPNVNDRVLLQFISDKYAVIQKLGNLPEPPQKKTKTIEVKEDSIVERENSFIVQQ